MDVNGTQGGAQADAGSTGADAVQSQQAGKQDDKVVRFEDHKRAIDDMLKYKAAAKELAQKQADLEAQLMAIREDKMKAEGNKDQLLDDYKQRLLKAEEDKKKFLDSFYSSKKYDAVYTEAVKAGLRKEAEADLELLTLDGVEVERTDAGRVLVHGASSYIEQIKQKRPHWFAAASAPNVNTGGAKGYVNEQSISAEELGKLAGKDPKKYRELLPKYLESRRKELKV